LFAQRKMKETDSKQVKISAWHRDSLLTPEQRHKLIQAKLARASRYAQALKQEAKLQFRR